MLTIFAFMSKATLLKEYIIVEKMQFSIIMLRYSLI